VNGDADTTATTITEGAHAAVLAHIRVRMESDGLVSHNADITFHRTGLWTRAIEIAALTDLAAGIAWKIERLLAAPDEEGM